MRKNSFQVLLPSGHRVNIKVTATNGKECKPEHAKEARRMFVDGERWNEMKKVQRPESPRTTDPFCQEVMGMVNQSMNSKLDSIIAGSPNQKVLDERATDYIHALEKEVQDYRNKLTFSGRGDQDAEIEQLKAKVENLNAKLRDTYRENEVFHNEMTDAQNRTEEERESRVQMECGILNIIRKMGQS